MALLLKPLMDLVYPPHCASCGCSLLKMGEGSLVVDPHLCGECRDGILSPPDHLCPMCSHPLPEMGSCPNCQGRDWHLHGIVAACRYQGVGEELIKRFKYGRDRSLAPLLADLLLGALGDTRFLGKRFDVLVPVPLHSLKEREREFNQSALLAECLSRLLGVPVNHLLRRTRATVSQTGLDRSARMKNLAGAFCLIRKPANGSRILLVDDVTTTGATLDACAGVLRESGVAEVYAVVIARGEWRQ